MVTLSWYPQVLLLIALSVGLYTFYRANRGAIIPLGIVVIIIAVQTVLSLAGFYLKTDAIPPRFGLLVAPGILLIGWSLFTKRGRQFLDKLDPAWLTLLHILRIPVEAMLWSLALSKAIPVAMTFEGTNFDIASGLSAPLVWYFGYRRQTLPKWVFVAWNLACLALLANVVVTAVLSVPGPFQKLNFDRPNLAVLHFPFALLPGFLVPMVLFSHMAALQTLLGQNRTSQS